jgi:hypothetical protein
MVPSSEGFGEEIWGGEKAVGEMTGERAKGMHKVMYRVWVWDGGSGVTRCAICSVGLPS